MRVKIIIDLGTEIHLAPENALEMEVLKRLPAQLEVRKLNGGVDFHAILFEDRSKFDQLKTESNEYPITQEAINTIKQQDEERKLKYGKTPDDDSSPYRTALR